MSKFKLLTLKSLYLLQIMCIEGCAYFCMVHSKNFDDTLLFSVIILLQCWFAFIYIRLSNLTKKSHDE